MFGNTKKLCGDRDRDLIRQQWPEMRFGEKCSYIWSYYKGGIVVGLILLAFAIFFVRDIATQGTEEAFYVMVLDSDPEEVDADAVRETLYRELELDQEEWDVVVETGYSSTSSNMQSEATVSTYMQSGRVDLLLAPEEKFNTYAATGYLQSLTESGYENLLERIEAECLFWAEQVDYSSGGAVTEIPMSPHDQTDDSDCYGIYLTEGTFEGMVIGIMVNAPHSDMAVRGMSVLMDF